MKVSSLDLAIKSFGFLLLFLLVWLMESCLFNLMFESDLSTTTVVDKVTPPTECIPFKIPMGIIDLVMTNRYVGDGVVHPSNHLLYIKELCDLFEIVGVSREVIMRKLFSLSLKEKALEWYRLLDNSHLLDWKEFMSLFYSKFYPLHEIHQDRKYIYNFWPRDGESIAQAWGRLKSLMLKCPNHDLSKDIIVNNFYARLSCHDGVALHKNY